MVSSKLRRPDLHAVQLDELVSAALREDLGAEPGDTDITTHFVVDADLMGEARIIAKKGGVLSGSEAAARVESSRARRRPRWWGRWPRS